MDWFLPRLLAAIFALTLGGAAGVLVGSMLDVPAVGAVIGAVAAVAVVVLRDAVRAGRVMRWLRNGQRIDVPSDPGLWGDLAYRIERALRERDQALAAERQRLAEFLSAIEASPNGVLLLDADDQIVWCSAAAADHLGLNALRDRNQPVTNLVRMPAFVAYLQDGVWREPIVLAAPDGSGTLQVVLRGYGDRQKLVITQDVTERLRAEAMRRDFVANVSHEIRTPLTVLAGFVETMASLPLSTAERARVITLMQQQSDRMQMLVADLLQLAQLEGSPRPPTDRWTALSRLMQRAADDARTLSAGRHQVSVDAPDDIELAGPEAELLSAIANLANNAVRYTPVDGKIHIGWRLRADGQGEVEVRDTGIGIAREHLPRLTERFYRVDGSRSRDTGGTGLGLSIVKHVMQRHGGSMEIDSEPGKGSRFRLVFPAGRIHRLSPAPPEQGRALHDITILGGGR